MSADILQFINNLKTVCYEDEYSIKTVKYICKKLCQYINITSIILDKNGDVLCENGLTSIKSESIRSSSFKVKIFEIETRTHISINSIPILVVPLGQLPNKYGTLILHSNNNFSNDDILRIEVSSMLLAMILKELNVKKESKVYNDGKFIKSAIGTLSYSELNAIIHIFNELNEKEGYVVASKVAKENKITRSSIISAIRKLESAGLIESRSLGMKGTYIKVLNDLFLTELKKLKL